MSHEVRPPRSSIRSLTSLDQALLLQSPDEDCIRRSATHPVCGCSISIRDDIKTVYFILIRSYIERKIHIDDAGCNKVHICPIATKLQV